MNYKSNLIVVLALGGLALTVLGITLGYTLARRQAASPSEPAAAGQGVTTWTCSMHPQIKLPKAGKCPICFMDLIPLADDTGDDESPRQLRMSPRAAGLAEIQTAPVRRQYATREVRLVGKVDYDETKVANITAWFPGRLDRLFVDFTGISVRQGDHLVSIYSPDLLVAQSELVQAWQAYQREGQASREFTELTLENAEEKLRLLGVLPEQMEEVKQRGRPSDHLTVYAPIGGIVIEKLANEGMYVETGTKIYTIADLSTVWVYLDAYESDVPWLRYGQQVKFTTESDPGEIFAGRIAFIHPVLNTETRTVRIRVNVPNADGRLKPGMFVRALVRSQLAAGGRVFDSSLVGKWISPMHPEVVKDGPGKCDVCGMDLVPAESLGYDVPQQAPALPLIIPATAPLITGKRAVVYVRLPDREQPTFEGREVLLGERAGDYFVVRHGLSEGEVVVTKGGFKIDSALQIQARPSMMSPESGPSATGHPAGDGESPLPLEVPEEFRRQLTGLYDAYLRMQTALADDQLEGAKEAFGELHGVLKTPEAGLLAGRTLRVWQATEAELSEALGEGWRSEGIEGLRKRFEPVSQTMLELVDLFGHTSAESLHRAFCPMAFDNRGAAWLQAGEQIANPYFGHMMLRCGTIQRDFPPSGDARQTDQGKEVDHEHQ